MMSYVIQPKGQFGNENVPNVGVPFPFRWWGYYLRPDFSKPYAILITTDKTVALKKAVEWKL